ncbi:hypothetical protein T4B_1187 [Trichinella pseudospiralis]|uniref:Uncharacterized protein n=1 Tax=Trichinella pseudospiralis TaxID=6337 RepID=A0A0V1H8W2_TRIPS|nr:hypothetical protein T4B_1187 [Trichinella pseudospiralis]
MIGTFSFLRMFCNLDVSAYYGWIEREYFCNGNYLNNLLVKPSDRAKMAADAKLLLRDFDGTFIDYPEILLAAANSGGMLIFLNYLTADKIYSSRQLFGL